MTTRRRILALVSEPVSGDALGKAVGDERARAAEVLVVAPALTTRTRFMFSDSDEAIGRAEEVHEETVERMLEEGVVDDAKARFGRPVSHMVVSR